MVEGGLAAGASVVSLVSRIPPRHDATRTIRWRSPRVSGANSTADGRPLVKTEPCDRALRDEPALRGERA
jgi:hypothetical protein